MATRDILVLNTTQSRAETQQGSDTVLIKGGGEILSIENSSASPILTFQSSGSSTNLSGKISSTGNISGVVTGSFGKVEGTTLIGSAFELSNTDLPGTLSSSAQIASKVTGSFRQGFEFDGTISGSIGSTGSFDRIFATTLVGDANNLTNTTLDDTISGSAQIAADISGSFNKGFEFDGTISGSETSTGSFTRVDAQRISGDGSLLTNYIKEGTISGSAQIAADISGSFNKGFEFTGTIKKALGTWTATNAINTARQQVTAFGSQNATVLAGGNVSPRNESETWNGTNWSEGNNLNTGRYGLASAGTATAGLVFGGNPAVADTETYDGTDYSEVNNLNTGRYGLGGWGTQNSAIAVGGAVSEYNNICALTEEWNGTNWSEVADLNAARWYMGTAGDSSESGIVFGGSYASPAFAVGIATTEQWNGSSWSEVNDLNVNLLYTRGQGSTNNAIAAGGLINSPTNTFSTCTETWDGTSWSVEASLNVAGRYLGIGGNADGAIAAGFSVEASPYAATNSELFEASFNTGSFGRVEATTLIGNVSNMTNQLKSGIISGSAQIASRISGSFNKGFNFDGAITSKPDAWTVGNNMNTQRAYGFSSAGQDKNAALIFGGRYAPNNAFCTCAEEWNGTNWSEVNNMSVPKYNAGMGGGSSESAISTGGCTSPAPSPYLTNDTEYWNGTNWAECANLPTAVRNAAGDGSTADIIVVGGYSDHTNSSAEACNQQFSLSGNSWSEGTDAPQNVAALDGTGTQNSFFIAYNSPSDSLEWNGTSWSTKAGKTHVTNQACFGIAGNADDAMTVGASSNVSANRTCTEMWNGFTWSVGEAMLIASQAPQAITGHSARSTVQFASDGEYCAHTQTFDSATDCINVNTLTANTLFGNGELLTNTVPDNTVSGSAQLAADISGSFNKGFEFDGTIEANPDQWSVGPSALHARTQMATAGNSRDAVLVFGGRYGNTPAGTFNNGGPTCTEEYNGTSWSEVNDLPSGRWQIFGAGTSESALAGDGTAAANTGVEYYNGTNWAEVASLITAVYRSVGIGDGGADDLLVVGGSPGSKCFQKYDLPGNAWSELADPINGVSNIGGTGTTDAAIIANYSPTPNAGQCWNGSSWSAFDSYTINRSGQSGIFGTQNDSIVMGANGNMGNTRCCTEAWDGTAWSECNAAPTGIAGHNALEGNSGNAGLAVGTSYGVTPNTPACGYNSWNGVQLWNGGFANSGSFGHLKAIEFVGSGSNITNITYPTNTLSGSSGIASDISGSFNKGFEFDGTIKPALGVWSTGGALSNAIDYHAVAGDKSGAISAMGTAGSWPTSYFAVPGGINTDCNEEYNGTSWSEANNNVTARARAAAAGSVDSGLFFGGLVTPWYGSSSAATETYNGTNWSEVNDMIIPRRAHMGAGTQNAALAIGGYKDTSHNPSDNPAATSTMDCNVELWNGTNWSNNGQAPAVLKRGAAAGTTNTTLVFGTPTNTTETYEWNGSSWSESGAHPARNNVGGGGSSNDGISFGGAASSPNRNVSEAATYDGSAWSATGNMINTLAYTGMGANQQAAQTAISVGGPAQYAPYAGSTCTEEFTTLFNTGSFTHLKATTFSGDGTGLTNTDLQGTISASAQLATDISGSFNKGFEFEGEIRTAKGVWSTSGNLNTARRGLAGTGIQNAGLATGGANASPFHSNMTNVSEEYDGTSWTEGNNLISARALLTGVGTQNAALFYGGWNTSTATEEYNGTSYATGGALSQGGYAKIGFGIQNAAFSTAGTISDHNGIRSESEQYDGSSWSTSISMLTPRFYGGAGSVNAGITAYGFRNLTYQTENCTELWDGTSWSETSEAVTSGQAAIEYGTQNAFAVTAGSGASPSPGRRATTQFFDGTAYSIDGDLNTLGMGAGARAPQGAGLVFGGNNPTNIATTEEYNAYYTTGSFGRVEAGDVHITNDSQLVVSSSLQIPVYATSTGIVSSSAGQMWFTTDDNKLNFTYDYNAWTETAALPTAIGHSKSGAGSAMDDALQFQGTTTQPGINAPGVTQQWNGISWTEVNALNEGLAFSAGVGLTSDSALSFGGCLQKACTEEWNGTNWTEVGDLNNGRHELGGAGTANAAWATQGEFHGGSGADKAEAWDGTSWSTVLSSGTPGYMGEGGMVTGTQQSHMIVTVAPAKTNAIWDGTSYSYANNLGVFGSETGEGGALFGTVNSSVYAGGQAHVSVKSSTYEWNGTSWNKSSATLNQGREEPGTSGQSSAGMIFGGSTGAGSPFTARANSEQYVTVSLKTQKVDGV